MKTKLVLEVEQPVDETCAHVFFEMLLRFDVVDARVVVAFSAAKNIIGILDPSFLFECSLNTPQEVARVVSFHERQCKFALLVDPIVEDHL